MPIDSGSAIHSASRAMRSLCPAALGSLVSTAVTRALSVRSWARCSSPYWTNAHRADEEGREDQHRTERADIGGNPEDDNRNPMTP